VEVASVLIRPVAKITNEEIVQKYKEATAKERKQQQAEHEKKLKHDQHLEVKKVVVPKQEKKIKDDETEEDEHAYMDTKKTHHVAHQKSNMLSLDEKSDVKVERVKNVYAKGGTVGLAVGSVAIFVVIVVAIVLLRKRSSNSSSRNFVEEVDQAASPEERHVANMQINGYENPTYKYFEISSN